MMSLKKTLFFRILSVFTAVMLIIGTGPGVSVIQAAGAPFQYSLPSPQEIIGTSMAYEPIMVRGMKINTDQVLNFSFVLDTGDAKVSDADIKAESEKIIKYFLASLTTSEDDLWVNLSPFEKDRITSDALYQTEMGRDLLGQDYILKKLTASLLFPDNESGRKFWDKIHSAIYEKLGDTNVPVDTFHKIWIVPESVELFVQGDTVLITSSKLRVMLEEDYFSLKQSQRLRGENSEDDSHENSLFRDESMKKVLKEVIVPIIEEEVNQGAHFANLRQIFHALILAKWFRQNFKQELLDKIKTSQAKPEEKEQKQQEQQQQQKQEEQKKEEKQKPEEQGPDIEEIYQKYLDAFHAGAEGYIREAYDPVQADIVIKKYVTGGVLANFKQADFTQMSDPEQLNLVSFAGKILYDVQFTLERILSTDAVQDVVNQITNPQVILTASVLVLLGAVAKSVGGIDLKTDEMKINVTGSGFDSSKMKDDLVIDPTKIGKLIPTDITSKPLPSINMFLGKQ